MDNPILAKLKQEFYESVKRREAMGLPPAEPEEPEADDSDADDEDGDAGYEAEPRRHRQHGDDQHADEDLHQTGSHVLLLSLMFLFFVFL